MAAVYDRIYAVKADDSGLGSSVRETVTLTIKPSTSYEVYTVTVMTCSRQVIPVRYTMRVFVFTMPQIA